MTDRPLPRQEHPRPDFHRGLREGRDWVNLNGKWAFEFDPGDVGEAEEWFDPGRHDFAGEIVVPFPWESHLAWGDEARASNEDYFSPKAFLDPASVTKANCREAPRHEIGWYGRSFSVPPRWRSERVILRFGAVDYFVRVWVNGRLVCDVESGYLPSEVDITDVLLPGAENRLVVRAYDPNDHEQQPVGKQFSWYARTAGIWQTVWLEPRPATYIETVRFAPDIETGEARCEVRLNRAPSSGIGFRLAIQMPEGGTRYTTWGADESLGAGPHTAKVTLEEPHLWSPEDPYLYPVTVELLEDAVAADLVHTHLAFREVTIKPLPGKPYAYLYLNGRPVYLRGALDQSFNPWGVYTFRSDEDLRRDLELARDLGFNFLRIHIKAEEPRFHYWADRLGMLTMIDMPSFGYEGWSEVACERWERTMRGILARDESHPSIIAWCLFNETWGLGGDALKTEVARQEWVERMVRLAKVLDPTRPVEDNSACLYDHVTTDINSWHFYLNDYAAAKEHLQHVVDSTRPGSGFNYCPGRVQGREPLLNSEYGGISAGMGDLDVSWCFHFLTNELRRHEPICGYVYTELQDIEWERNGLLNYDRTPKELGYDPTALNAADFLALDGPPCRTAQPGEPVRVPAFASHFGAFVGDHATLRWRLELMDALGRTGEVSRHPGRRCPCPRFAVTPLGALEAAMPERPGVVTLHAWLEATNGEVIARNWTFLHVVGEDPALGLVAVPLDGFRSEGAGVFEVEGRAEAVWVEGAGALTAPMRLPEGVAVEGVRAVHLVAELSSCRPGGGGKQTDDDRWPSRVAVRLGEAVSWEVELADQPADERGVLSHHYGFAGRYGELVKLPVPDDALAAVLPLLQAGTTLTVEAVGDPSGGWCVYGERAGRYPVGLALLVERQ